LYYDILLYTSIIIVWIEVSRMKNGTSVITAKYMAAINLISTYAPNLFFDIGTNTQKEKEKKQVHVTPTHT